jgi:hypothetical protein
MWSRGEWGCMKHGAKWNILIFFKLLLSKNLCFCKFSALPDFAEQNQHRRYEFENWKILKFLEKILNFSKICLSPSRKMQESWNLAWTWFASWHIKRYILVLKFLKFVWEFSWKILNYSWTNFKKSV